MTLHSLAHLGNLAATWCLIPLLLQLFFFFFIYCLLCFLSFCIARLCDLCFRYASPSRSVVALALSLHCAVSVIVISLFPVCDAVHSGNNGHERDEDVHFFHYYYYFFFSFSFS